MPQTFTKEQAAAFVSAVYNQVTGKQPLAAVDPSAFVSMADATLNVGVDPLMTAISQVYSKTIYSYRPYETYLGGLDKGATLYGNAIRKLTALDAGDMRDDSGYLLKQDDAIDQYIVNKPKMVQTNFYGSNVWQYPITIYEKQVRSAFKSAEGVQEFLSMTLGELDNHFKQQKEWLAVATLCNLIAAYQNGDMPDECTVHVLTEYNAYTGGSYTAETVMSPENIKGFMQWFAGRVEQERVRFAARTVRNHVHTVDNVNGVSGEILRHTPRDKQRLYMLAKYKIFNSNLVLSNTYNPQNINTIEGEWLPYWQNPADEETIQLTAFKSMPNNGKLVSGTTVGYKASNVMGILMDVDAAGYSMVDEGATVTPMNARGRYYNIWYNFDRRYYNDVTEKGAVFVLD